jgi:putative copper export protein
MAPDALSVLLRTAAFICLLQAAGAVFFLRLFGSRLRGAPGRIAGIARRAALIAAPLLLLQQAMQAARMAGGYEGLRDAALERLAWFSHAGAAALIQSAAAILMVLVLRRRRCVPSWSAGAAAAVALAAFALRGHTSTQGQRVLLAPLLILHLLIVAFWFGALLPLWLTAVHETAEDALAIWRGFSSVAGALVPCIAVAGLCMALIMIPNRQGWLAPYGLLLLSKLAIFMLLLLLAGWNRWRGVPLLARRGGAAAPLPLRRSLLAEVGLICTAVALTVVLTGFYSP